MRAAEPQVFDLFEHSAYPNYYIDAERGIVLCAVLINAQEFTGSAKTSPEDTFDPQTGQAIAYARALSKAARIARQDADLIAGERIFSRPKGHRGRHHAKVTAAFQKVKDATTRS